MGASIVINYIPIAIMSSAREQATGDGRERGRGDRLTISQIALEKGGGKESP